MTAAEPKTIALLGVPFHDVTMAETLEAIDEIVAKGMPRYIATANLDFAAQASKDVELHRILLDAHLVLCDGTPLVWASRWLKAPLRERVAGSDLTPKLAEHAASRGYRVFFLGSDDAVLLEAKARLEARFPGLNVCDVYAPPYARLLDLNNDEIVQRVRAAKPDILLVALGAPKQEKWIYMHHREVGVPCSIGIGASLDFVAGKFSRAPVWMRKAGLEWVHRLAQEPRRLFRRYFFDLTFFISALRKQRRLQRERPPACEAAPKPSSKVLHPLTRYEWSGRADAAAVASGSLATPGPREGCAQVVLDAAGVTFIDSTGLGLLLRGFKACKAAGGGVVLLRPSECVRQLLVAMKLDRLMPIAGSEVQARALLRIDEEDRSSTAEFEHSTQRLLCRCAGELDANHAEDFNALVQAEWRQNPTAQHLQVDLAEVDFMDSSGLGCLLRMRKLVRSRTGATFELVGAKDNVRNVIRMSQVGELLGVA